MIKNAKLSLMGVCTLILTACVSSAQTPVLTPSPVSEAKTSSVSLKQLNSEFTIDADEWTQTGFDFDTEIRVKYDSLNVYQINTHFRKPVKLGIGGFDATMYGRFLVCLSGDIAERNNQQKVTWLTLESDSNKKLSDSQDDQFLLVFSPKKDADAFYNSLKERFPLYEINKEEVVSGSTFSGLFKHPTYCSFYKSNFK